MKQIIKLYHLLVKIIIFILEKLIKIIPLIKKYGGKSFSFFEKYLKIGLNKLIIHEKNFNVEVITKTEPNVVEIKNIKKVNIFKKIGKIIIFIGTIILYGIAILGIGLVIFVGYVIILDL